jgi:hypothetical protein
VLLRGDVPWSSCDDGERDDDGVVLLLYVVCNDVVWYGGDHACNRSCRISLREFSRLFCLRVFFLSLPYLSPF